MPTNIVATTDSPQYTVAQMLKDPLFIPQLVLDQADQLFAAEKILRPAGRPAGGTVVYYESTPLYAGSTSEYVEEFGEIPAAIGQLGTPKSARSRKRALGVVVSQEMRDRNQVDLVNTQVTQVRNTLGRDFDGTFWTAILAAGTNTFAASTGWTTSTHIRKDILAARKLVLDQKMGFMPDTLVVNPTDANNLLTSSEITQTYVGNMADQNPLLSGRLNFGFAGLDVLQTYGVPAGTAVMVQKGRVGGYADERPLQATPTYLWKPEAETWRTDVLRTTAVFIDQPLAATVITGI